MGMGQEQGLGQEWGRNSCPCCQQILWQKHSQDSLPGSPQDEPQGLGKSPNPARGARSCRERDGDPHPQVSKPREILEESLGKIPVKTGSPCPSPALFLHFPLPRLPGEEVTAICLLFIKTLQDSPPHELLPLGTARKGCQRAGGRAGKWVMPFRRAGSPSKWGTRRAWGRGTAGPASRRGSCAWSCCSKRCHQLWQPPASSNLFPDYVSLDKRELFGPWFQLKQYSELTEGGGWV